MIRTIEISFGAPVPHSPELVDAVHALCRTTGPCVARMISTGEHSMRGITVQFERPVNMPDGLDRALTDVTDLACKAYERANPTRVMWPAGIGFKPQWSRADAAFLGEAAAPGAPESGEPTFDEETFSISCEEREDYHGRNPLNPEGERLRAAADAETAVRRARSAAPTDWGYRRGLRDGGTIAFNAVMSHESNAGRGMDLFLQLKEVAADALASGIIVADPDEQPLWEHLIEESYADFFARHRGRAPYSAAVGMQVAFTLAVRSMLTKKLPAPDSENMRLREALCSVLKALGNGAYAEPIASVKFLTWIPDEVRITVDRLRGALRVLYEETADYIRVNNLGDVHHNRSMQLARDALAGASSDQPKGAFTVDNPCKCGAYGGPESHARWCEHARGLRAAPTGPMRYVDAPKELQDALLAYHARPCDEEAGAVVRAVLNAYGPEASHG